jgi:hypothetical protein
VEKEDGRVLNQWQRRDWQRVEIDMQLFSAKARTMHQRGWRDVLESLHL